MHKTKCSLLLIRTTLKHVCVVYLYVWLKNRVVFAHSFSCIFSGISIDSEDLVLVSIKEAVQNPDAPATPPPEDAANGSDEEVSDSASTATSDNPNRKRKRRRKKQDGGESPAKVSRPQSENEHDDDNDADNEPLPSYADSEMGGGDQYDANSTMDNSRAVDDMSNDDSSMFTLQEMKQDSDDDDLIEIIKEEPARYSQNQERIVSIQSLNDSSNSLPMMQGMSPGPMPPGSMTPGGMPMPMPPGALGDLNEVLNEFASVASSHHAAM